MTGKREYVSSLVEESLGLVKGHLDRYPLEQDLIEEVSGVLRGSPSPDLSRPFLEERMISVAAVLRETALREDGFFLRKARWPKAARLAVCLTHDVDNVRRPASHLWKTRSRFGFLDLLGGLLGAVNLYDNVRLIRSREEGHGFRSSFYFLTSNYPLSEIRAETEAARNDGWDIGLHGDFGTHDSLSKMNEAVSRFSRELGFKPVGLREHYLKFDFSVSWDVMEKTGFDYDTTVGTNDRLGFRLGLASPFHPPDTGWSPTNLVEIPLVLMDTTLWGYLKRSEQEGFADSMRMLDQVERVEGLFTLLWHQEAVRMRGGRIYWRLLDALKSRGCHVATAAEVASWWRLRSVPLVRDGKLIRLGAEAPKDLVLRLETPEGREPVVRSASLEGEAPSRVLRNLDRRFELEAS